jgi:DMSO/TMAO reductase YedYZ heme-binding membrane subunit
MGKIVAVSVSAIVVIVAVLAVTKIGHVIDAATQHFMLYYAGVLALVGLTGSVLLGLVATDRIVMTPGHRVMAQAVHRAFSFGTLAFLIIHITTEILAQRSHVLDAVVPFLSPYRTFYIGLGTIASDLILLLVITSILRKRFTAHGKAWRWRAMHYSSYVAFVFGVLHGLLGGRAAKPYVDWSYGFAIAVTALGLAVRFLAVSLRPKESLSTSPSVDRAGPGSASPMRAAAMAMAQAQLSGAQFGSTVQVLPAALGAGGVADTGSWTATALPVQGRSPASGPLAAIGPAPDYGADYGAVPDYGTRADYGAAPAYVGAPPVVDAYGALPDPYSPVPDPYGDLGFTPLGAPPYGDDPQNGMRARPYVTGEPSRPAVGGSARQPRYEPGYDGPPRFEGAPRGHGDVPQDTLSSYPYGPPGHRAKPISPPYPEAYQDRGAPEGYAAPWPGPAEPARPRAAIAGPSRPAERNSGPQPRFGSGPMPRPDTGPMPRLDAGPMPRPDTGPMPRVDSGPMPRPDTGSFPRVGGGQPPRHGTGPAQRTGRRGAPRADTGSMPRLGTGPMPRPDTGPMPRVDNGPMPRVDSGPMPRPDTGPRPVTGSTRSGPRHGRPVTEPATGPRTGSQPRSANRPSHRAQSTDPRYRDIPGPTGGGEWE